MTQPALFDPPKPPPEPPPAWTKQLPDWLANNLQNINHTRRRNSELLPCPRCEQPTLKSKDSTTEHIIDPTRIDAAAELAEVLAGRTAADLDINRHTGIHIIARRHWRIREHPPNDGRFITVPAHHCTRTIGEPLDYELLYYRPPHSDPNAPPPF